MPDIEVLATTKVKEQMALSDILETAIAEKDKIPSFDGEIYIEPHGHKCKKDLLLVRVQVKGKQVKGRSDTDGHVISFDADVVDLQNYRRNGGVLFFVVLCCGVERTVFYSSLTPVKLSELLVGHDHQKTLSIKLYRLPESTIEVEEIAINHAIDSLKQASFVDSDFEAIRTAAIEKDMPLVIGYTAVAGSQYEAALHTLGKECYLYVHSDEFGFQIPTGEMVEIRSVEAKRECALSVEGVTHFNRVSERTTGDLLTWVFNPALTIKAGRHGQDVSARMKFDWCGTIGDRLRALRFIKSVVEHGGFELDDNSISIVDVRKENHQALRSSMGWWTSMNA